MENEIKKFTIQNRGGKIIHSPLMSEFDTDGSYTGVPLDKNETPVQDADDL
ncbi:MAG: hypothetical protein LBL93_05000 [Ruminococcus sp.]|jgi:hypothetical protein|nr:hypothetical protein [Ruminococcus sp.]